MTSLALEARGLHKRFGSTVAVVDFSLSVEAGAIFGLIGPNGAGKTTSIRMLATLLEPDGGEAWIGSASIRTDQAGVRRKLGYMPDFFGVYPELKAGEYLEFYAACHGVPADRRPVVTADLLHLVDLSHKRDSYVQGLSRGMQQRLGLARALVHDPAVLLLDEPASGLDPRARLELREVVRELGRMGKAIVISSHILAELADLCTHIAIVDGGQVVTAGTVEEVTRRLHGGRSVRVQVLNDGERLRDLLLSRPDVHAVELEMVEPAGATDQGAMNCAPTGSDPVGAQFIAPDGAGRLAMVRFVLDGDERALQTLLAELVGAGLPIFGFGQDVGDLEDVFLRVTRRLGDERDEAWDERDDG
ncbi:MAG TPA: ABC transporter ATP-binding protein [Chloroflexota bacterium]|nr:ABC transporter ATP-binding protein [Chloroflexota bacterium]